LPLPARSSGAVAAHQRIAIACLAHGLEQVAGVSKLKATQLLRCFIGAQIFCAIWSKKRDVLGMS